MANQTDGVDEDDYTVVVNRKAKDPVEEDHTVVVNRKAKPPGEEDQTIVVDRGLKAPAEEDHTVVVDRGVKPPAEEDHTVVVDRKAKPPAVAPPAARDRRRGISPPPGASPFAPPAVAAVGPGVVVEYVPRAIVAPPALPETPDSQPEHTRAAGSELPSVAKRTRRKARTVLVLFVIACIGAVAGLAAIIFALISL